MYLAILRVGSEKEKESVKEDFRNTIFGALEDIIPNAEEGDV